MKTVTTVTEAKGIIGQWKKEGRSIGFVPTMGYLHEGHGSLISRAAENDKVVVSIFVNPMQFGKNEDLGSYPRDFKKDCELCQSLGVDLVFHPDPSELYTPEFHSFVDMSVLTQNLCGKSRPGHFRGVCTVVNKLFNIVKPDKAYFGEKDAQQLAIVKRMVQDLNMDVEIIGCPIVREPDGLAKSSRNTYLNREERKAALVLSKAVNNAEIMVKRGETDSKAVTSAMAEIIQGEPLARIDYVTAVNSLTMEDTDIIKPQTLIAIAVYIGKTRLIDNLIVK